MTSTAPVPASTLSPREQALVALLAQGHTDAVAARELAISERSVTNIMRGLMDRFNVDNRFQLGAALGALGAAPLPSRPLPSPSLLDPTGDVGPA